MTLDINDLRFAYKKHPVLNGVSFSATPGECICVLGENGAGKTTLFRCLLGLINDYKGDIVIGGVNARRLSIIETARRIAYIPQAHAPSFNFSVFESVLMGTNAIISQNHNPGKAEYDIAEKMLELMNISHLSKRGYAELSGGERQLVLIARALAQKSSILVMDEPTASLDYGNQFRVMKQVKLLARQGYLIILSTHNPEHALLYADKALVIKDGKSLHFGNPKSVLSPSVIQSIYGVSVALKTWRTQTGDVDMFVPCVE